MNTKITAVINTFNEQENIKIAISSVNWANEIIICDMHSTDKTVEIAQKMGAKIIYHKKENYVEPARNFAISKATGDWVLIVDADEEIPGKLADRLKNIAGKEKEVVFVEIPRKNIIFGKWMQATGWWPDYQIRFFKKRTLIWKEAIHSKPETKGLGLTLEPKEELAIIHHNYQSVGQFLERMSRYTDIEAKQLKQSGYAFNWTDLIQKPLEEFLSRFFASLGYKDGLHGLALSTLQAFSSFILYLKLWEERDFPPGEIDLPQIEQEAKKAGQTVEYWFKQSKRQNPFKKFIQKLNF